MDDSVNSLGKNIAEGFSPMGWGEMFQKLDPQALGNALKAYLGFGAAPSQPLYNPNAPESIRRQQLPPIGGGVMDTPLPMLPQPQPPVMQPMPITGPIDNTMQPLPIRGPIDNTMKPMNNVGNLSAAERGMMDQMLPKPSASKGQPAYQMGKKKSKKQ